MEDLVNEAILDAVDVQISEEDIDKAKEMGAMALFGEKYGKIVRVVNVPGHSMELCGGVHVSIRPALVFSRSLANQASVLGCAVSKRLQDMEHFFTPGN